MGNVRLTTRNPELRREECHTHCKATLLKQQAASCMHFRSSLVLLVTVEKVRSVAWWHSLAVSLIPDLQSTGLECTHTHTHTVLSAV
jgi:hypothetical protein